MQKLNFIVILIYFILLSYIWISHDNPDMLIPSSTVHRGYLSLQFQDLDTLFEPIVVVKPQVYLTDLNKEIAEPKPDFNRQNKSSFTYYYLTDHNRGLIIR